MPTTSHRGFTIVEALVAATLVMVAGAFFARTSIATTRARARAAQLHAAAAAIRARAAFAELSRCAGTDTSGVEQGAGLVEHWSAVTGGGGVTWRDSVVAVGAAPVVASGRATCAE